MKGKSFLCHQYFYSPVLEETGVENGQVDTDFVISISNSSSFLISDFLVSSPETRLLMPCVFSCWLSFFHGICLHHCVPVRACCSFFVPLPCLYFDLSCCCTVDSSSYYKLNQPQTEMLFRKMCKNFFILNCNFLFFFLFKITDFAVHFNCKIKLVIFFFF